VNPFANKVIPACSPTPPASPRATADSSCGDDRGSRHPKRFAEPTPSSWRPPPSGPLPTPPLPPSPMLASLFPLLSPMPPPARVSLRLSSPPPPPPPPPGLLSSPPAQPPFARSPFRTAAEAGNALTSLFMKPRPRLRRRRISSLYAWATKVAAAPQGDGGALLEPQQPMRGPVTTASEGSGGGDAWGTTSAATGWGNGQAVEASPWGSPSSPPSTGWDLASTPPPSSWAASPQPQPAASAYDDWESTPATQARSASVARRRDRPPTPPAEAARLPPVDSPDPEAAAFYRQAFTAVLCDRAALPPLRFAPLRDDSPTGDAGRTVSVSEPREEEDSPTDSEAEERRALQDRLVRHYDLLNRILASPLSARNASEGTRKPQQTSVPTPFPCAICSQEVRSVRDKQSLWAHLNSGSHKKKATRIRIMLLPQL